MHNEHSSAPFAPANEWVPPLKALAGQGFATAPRNWPQETEYTSSTRNDQAVRHVPPAERPSYYRQTTVAGAGRGPSALQMALQGDSASVVSSQVMRGAQRARQKDAMRLATVASLALEERQAAQIQHASWLETAPEKADVVTKPYAEARSLALGAPAAPSTSFRSAMRVGGTSSRPHLRHCSVKKAGSLAAVVQRSKNESMHEGSVGGAVAKHLKARALRFEHRLSMVANTLKVLQADSTARPGNQQLVALHKALKTCGVENSDALVVSRNQFNAILQRTFPALKREHPVLGDSLYSCFDPGGRDRARYDCLVAGLLIGNRPDLYKLVGFLGGETHGSQFSDLLPVLKATFDLFGTSLESTETSVTADDVREMLKLSAQGEDDIMAMEALWADAARERFRLPPRDRGSRRIKWEEFIGKLSDEAQILTELKRQLTAYQFAVKEFIAEN